MSSEPNICRNSFFSSPPLFFPTPTVVVSSGALVPEFEETVPRSCADTHPIFWDTSAAYPVVMARKYT